MSKHKLLGVPVIVWVLQLLYVGLALGLFALLSRNSHEAHQPLFQFGYVLLMLAVNIAWRVAIRKTKPDWF